ncbi:MAG: hypothetical protein MZU84_00705 [Sphingobacterium sp.]|nr:hypothetical protein [Sphingobacterium sp.]
MAEAAPPLTTVAWTVAAVSVAVMTLRLFRKSYFSDTLFGAAVILFLLQPDFCSAQQERARPGELSERRQQVTVRLSGYPEKRNASWSFRARIISVTEDDSIRYPRGSLMLWFMSDTLPQPGNRAIRWFCASNRARLRTTATRANSTTAATWKARG